MESFTRRASRRAAERTWEHWKWLLVYPGLTAAVTILLLWIFREPIGIHVLLAIVLALAAAAIVVVVMVFMNVALAGAEIGREVSRERDEAVSALQQAQVTREMTDDEIVAVLSDRTKQQIRAQAQNLLSGKAGAPWFDASVNSEMQSHRLVEIQHVPTPPARGFHAPVVNAMYRVTPLGARIIGRLM